MGRGGSMNSLPAITPSLSGFATFCLWVCYRLVGFYSGGSCYMVGHVGAAVAQGVDPWDSVFRL
ncbi:hypothetical protein U1Q18_029249, partial [Sarracenia purpurea var. burkii]